MCVPSIGTSCFPRGAFFRQELIRTGSEKKTKNFVAFGVVLPKNSRLMVDNEKCVSVCVCKGKMFLLVLHYLPFPPLRFGVALWEKFNQSYHMALQKKSRRLIETNFNFPPDLRNVQRGLGGGSKGTASSAPGL